MFDLMCCSSSSQVPTYPCFPTSLSALIPHYYQADPQGPSSPNILRHNSKSTVIDILLNQIPEFLKSIPLFSATHITHTGSNFSDPTLLAVFFPIHILLPFLYLLYYDLYVFLLQVVSFSLVVKTLHKHFINSCWMLQYMAKSWPSLTIPLLCNIKLNLPIAIINNSMININLFPYFRLFP